MVQTLAMILAGGRGRRMDILCKMKPKPALPFAGRFRVIDFSLSNCVHSQIKNIAVLTDYQRSYMAKYLENWCMNNPDSGEIHILEPRDGSYKGTADAVYQNISFLKEVDDDMVLILAGDHVYKMDYREMVVFHKQMDADVTVGVIPAAIEEAHRFGIVNVDPEGRVVDFVEKPMHPESNLVSMGIYVFNKEVLSKQLIKDAACYQSPHDFGYAILPKMVLEDKVFAYKFDNYWRDIGTTAAYYETNMEILNKQAALSLEGKLPVLTAERDSPIPGNLKTDNVINSIISPDCVVKGHVENSILSPGVCIEREALVKNSVLMSDVFVGYHSIVDQCILDEEVDIENYCYIGFGGSLPSEDQNATVIGEGAVVPTHTAIGKECKVLPYVGPGDFTTSAVPSGSVVTK